jgi:hypothetical protein
VRIGLDAGRRGNALADRDHGTPLGEARAHAEVLGHALPEPVQALGHLLAGMQRHVVRAGVDLDAGDDSARLQVLAEVDAVLRRLAQRLVEEDHAAHVLLDARGGEEQLPVCPAVLLRGLDLHGIEALLARARALVGGEQALARRHHGSGGFGHQAGIHGKPPEGVVLLGQFTTAASSPFA